MPNPIPLEAVKQKLPSFVKIKDETYKGIRYKATFIDTEYNEEFEAIVRAVIDLQHGCKTRANKRRGESCQNKGRNSKTPIEDIRKKLPDYLEIDESSYRGIRYSAKFYDKEYKVWFEGLVCNILRHGLGYCAERKMAEFKKSIKIPLEEIKRRVKEVYKDKIILIDSSYLDTNSACLWKLDGRIIKIAPYEIFRGQFLERRRSRIWRNAVLDRDNHSCQQCHSLIKLQTHHVLGWTDFVEHRFNLNNGICLCKPCHDNYHSVFKFKESVDTFCEWIGDEKKPLACDIRARLAAPIILIT